MILGMSTATYIFLQLLISLVGIVSGLIVMYGPHRGQATGRINCGFFDYHGANQRVRLRFSIRASLAIA